MTDGKPDRDAEGARALDGRPARHGRQRQRGDPHQVIGAKTVHESEREG
jgi:hypothetical protein